MLKTPRAMITVESLIGGIDKLIAFVHVYQLSIGWVNH